jgi:hypothetical protein
MVRSLAGVGRPHEDIGALVGCTEKTLRKHYREELDEGAEDANAAVVGFLMAQIKKGNVAAMIFFEKARGGKCETLREEITGPGGGPIRTTTGLDSVLPCNGIGPCPRRIADYKADDEERSPLGMTRDEVAQSFGYVMALGKEG